MDKKIENKNMDLKEFVKNVLTDLVDAVEEARATSVREIYLSKNDKSRTVEFDIAVTAESQKSGGGKGGIKVINFFEISGGAEGTVKNSTVSRVQFGVTIDTSTKEQHRQFKNEVNNINNSNNLDLI